ncbi:MULTISPECIES: hypothetical protein [Pseudomonas]|uniref:hypothetical protein n=1 Tax=Pseudomonas TaxID=286 RepID=UPI0018D601CB|nr:MULTISPECIES: hypothetical protein [Pseudomonas]
MMCEDSNPPTYYLIRSPEENTIEVMELYDSDSHTLREYTLASRKSWPTPSEATQYGIQLAKDGKVTFKHDRNLDPESYQESMYLD